MNSTVPLLTSIAIIGRHFPELSKDLRVVETIQAFADSSVAFSLSQACENSSLRLVQRVLARTGWNVENVVDGLCVAAKQGNLDILKWLSEVENQISRTRVQNLVNYRNSGKTTALQQAAQFGHLGVVKWLIDKGARVATQDADGQTAMLVAAANGQLVVVQWLVEKGSFVNETNRRGRNAVHLAAENGYSQMVKWLVEHGAAVNLKDRIDRTPMHLAAENGHELVVEYLVKHLHVVHAFDIDAKDYEQLTALHLAAGRGHLSVLQCLVSKGARINQRARHGQTALHFAAGGGHIEVVQWLADSGAAVRGGHFDFISSLPSSTTGNGSQTALCDAAMNGYLPVVEFFVERGLDPYMVNESGHTPLYYATIGRRFHVVEFFLTKYSDVEKWQQSELWRVLFAAAKGDQDGILKLLYEQYWSIICLPNTQGRTPLHSAAASGELKAVQFLLGHEVNPHQVDTFGISPCIEACRHRHLDVLRCFLDAGVNMNASNLAGRTALHCAADSGFEDVVDELLVYGADINLQDRRGWTPLHCAAASGKLSVVEMLVCKGAAVNAETISGKTALVIAMEKGRSSVTDYLIKQAELAFASTLSKTSGSVALSNYSAYALNSSDIHLESIKGKRVGMWLDSPIEVKFKETQSTNFFEELDRWSKLNHPHLVKLYGFCYNSDGHIPMFVYERATKGSLLEFLGDPMDPSARSKLWDKLYEASLGLQYLHDRNVVHGELSCDSIVISGSGSAKLRNLGRENTTAEYRLPWTAPEILAGFPATFESDVYAFGITIVEAVKRVVGYRSTPWSIICSGDSVFQNLTSHILSGGTPDKPVDMTDAQWQLVKRMCSYNPRDRISASDAVRELETFTTDFKVLHEITLGLSELNAPPLTWANLGDFVVDETSLRTISNVLEDIEILCGNSSPMDMMYRDVFSRLADVFHQLKTRQDEPTRDLVQHYADILCHFSKKLQNAHTIGSASAVRFAESRQGADNTFSIHGNLDLFIERANLSRLSQLHQWREIWDRQRKKQQHEMLEKLENLPGLMDEVKDEKQREIALAYLRFELSKHPTCYAASKAREFASAKSAITSITPQKNTSWFIPAYEVEFDKFDEFSRGAFGKVYLGKWKRSRVVVKKLKLKNEEHEAAFLNEVEIWHLLYHPHIVQLFGACHIGQPFFVCEYAGGGQLDRYLKKHPNEAMEKLYEAALGLRYLHVKRVVHGDLKCNNILIGSDGRAKLADFGLSTLEPEMPSETKEPESEEQSKEKPKIGAIRWKAPEVLQGEKSSFASDIYSFGMCVLEAVSGAFPWGLLEDIAVKYYVLKEQRIPRRPENCSEQVYDLVQQMCRFTPGERVDIHQVVNELKTFIPRSRLERV